MPWVSSPQAGLRQSRWVDRVRSKMTCQWIGRVLLVPLRLEPQWSGGWVRCGGVPQSGRAGRGRRDGFGGFNSWKAGSHVSPTSIHLPSVIGHRSSRIPTRIVYLSNDKRTSTGNKRNVDMGLRGAHSLRLSPTSEFVSPELIASTNSA